MYKLIEGTFTPDDARDIIIPLFKNKIQYHSLNSFSSYERTGKYDEHSIAKIKELKSTLNSIVEMLDGCESMDLVKINSTITLEII
jgi:hypothetical protein